MFQHHLQDKNMKTINSRELRKRYEMDGSTKTVEHLTEALESGDLKPEDFSLRDLAESLVPDGLRDMDPRSGRTVSLLEGDNDAFLNIVGAVIETKILDSYNNGVFALSKMVETIPTRFDGEKIHGASLADAATLIEPGAEYPTVGFGADYIETPSTTKHGLIVPVTREAIFFDRTHLVLSRAAEVGEALALNKEKRILDMVLGLTKTYKYNGATLDTYCTGTTGDPWKNVLSNNALKDWTNIDAAENLLGEMTDPNTDEHILVEPNAVLVMPSSRHIAHRLFYASEVSYNDTTSTKVSAIPNPYAKYKMISSRLAYRRLLAATPTIEDPEKVWFLGNFTKAFAYMENWPITVTQSVAGSEADFTQDIVVRFKASERGTPAVLNPRFIVKCVG